MSIRPGIILQHQFEVGKEIGSGGSGSVYRGKHLTLGIDCAIKVLKGGLHPSIVRLFHSEARRIAALDHPNIIRIYDNGTENGVPYMVLALAEESYFDRIKSGYIFSLHEVLEIMRQAGAGLQFAHDNNIIHRDIKPHNLLILKSGRCVVTDFGIAINAGRLDDAVVGTLAYMAPEQFEGHATKASDIYALAVTAYELLTGQVPFHGQTNEDFMEAHCHAPNVIPLQLAGVPHSVIRVLLRAMAVQPEQRHGSIEKFVQALEYAVSHPTQKRVRTGKLLNLITKTDGQTPGKYSRVCQHCWSCNLTTSYHCEVCRHTLQPDQVRAMSAYIISPPMAGTNLQLPVDDMIICLAELGYDVSVCGRPSPSRHYTDREERAYDRFSRSELVLMVVTPSILRALNTPQSGSELGALAQWLSAYPSWYRKIVGIVFEDDYTGLEEYMKLICPTPKPTEIDGDFEDQVRRLEYWREVLLIAQNAAI